MQGKEKKVDQQSTCFQDRPRAHKVNFTGAKTEIERQLTDMQAELKKSNIELNDDLSRILGSAQ